MANQIQKRLNYFNGQFLQVEDFRDEQKYHIDRQRGHNKTLHISGVTEGLVVSPIAENPKQISISKGTAIDNDGQQIVLSEKKQVRLEGYRNETVYLVISFHEKFGDPKRKNDQENTENAQEDKKPEIQVICKLDGNSDAGIEKKDGEDKTRIHEQPKIQVISEADANPDPAAGKKIKLAKLTINNSGDIEEVHDCVRQYSGLRLPGPDNGSSTLRTVANGRVSLSSNLQVTGLFVRGTTVSNENEPEIEDGRTYLGGSLTVKGKTSLDSLTVVKTSTLNGGLTVHGITTLDAPLRTDNQKASNGKLTVNVPTEFNNTLTVVKGKTELQGELTVHEATTLNSTLTIGRNEQYKKQKNTKLIVHGHAELNHGLFARFIRVSGKEPLRLYSSEAIQFYINNDEIAKIIGSTSSTGKKPTLHVNRDLTVDGATTLNETLTVGQSGQKGELIVHGDTTLHQPLTVKANVNIGTHEAKKKLHVEGDLEVNGTIFLDGTELSTGHLKAFDSKGNLKLDVTGHSYLQGSLSIGPALNTQKPKGKLHIINNKGESNLPALMLGDSKTYLKLGYNPNYSWIESGYHNPLVINLEGNYVGIGEKKPQAKLHIYYQGSGNSFLIARPPAKNESQSQKANSFELSICIPEGFDNSSAWPFGIIQNGKAIAAFDTEGNLTLEGQVLSNSTKEVQEDNEYLSYEKALEIIKDLNPISFTYKKYEKKIENLGFMADAVPTIIAPDRKMISQMNIVAVLTRVVKDMQEEITSLISQMEQLSSKVR